MLADLWCNCHHCCLTFSPPIQTNGAPGSVHVCLGWTCTNTSRCPFSGVFQHISDNGLMADRAVNGLNVQHVSNAMETASATG